MYFESHAHYDDTRFEEDRVEILEGLKEKGVDYVINIGADMASSKMSIELAKEYPFIYCSVGVHPHEVEHMAQGDIDKLKEFANNEKVVAIGEIGLDYYYDLSPRELQQKWFKKQLQLAQELDLPIVVHSRDACAQTFEIIKEHPDLRGVIHCFSGSKELAKEYVKRGFYIGIGGSLTFKNARKTVEVVQEIPIEFLLIETDSPYLAPVPHRGKRNDSSYLVHVVEKIADIKGITPEEVAKITMQNAKNLFKIK